jgi:hypothetical protein
MEKTRSQLYYEANKETIKAKLKIYYQQNKERIAKQQKEYAGKETTHEKRKEIHRRYNQRHPRQPKEKEIVEKKRYLDDYPFLMEF